MTRFMDENETRYVKILNKNNQINITPIIPRFCTVQRFLTPSEMKACLAKGASLSAIEGDKLIPLTKENCNIIEVKDIITETKEELVVETPAVEEKKETSDIITEVTPEEVVPEVEVKTTVEETIIESDDINIEEDEIEIE